MALLCASDAAARGKKFIAASTEANVIVAEEDNGTTRTVTLNSTGSAAAVAGGDAVVAMTASCQGQLLAVCTNEKRLVVWETEQWRVRGERTVSKRVTALQFTRDEEYILTADKTGEVTRYRTSNLSAEGEEILGHLSMLLDMVMVSHDSHVITCDRDEKIRVSRYPNSYNIETYCLGHSEFVSSVCVCEKWPHILLSASGDGSVRSWNWQEGRLLDTWQCPLREKGSTTVTQVVCTRTREVPLVIASLDQSPELTALLLSSDGKFQNLPASISLAASPWSCAFDWLDRLWVCLPYRQGPVECLRYNNGVFQKCSDYFRISLNRWDLFKGCVDDRDWSGLRKHTYDNMSSYLARKEQRVREKAVGKEQLPTVEEAGGEEGEGAGGEEGEGAGGEEGEGAGGEEGEGAGGEEGDKVLQEPPPEKKVKLQTVES